MSVSTDFMNLINYPCDYHVKICYIIVQIKKSRVSFRNIKSHEKLALLQRDCTKSGFMGCMQAESTSFLIYLVSHILASWMATSMDVLLFTIQYCNSSDYISTFVITIHCQIESIPQHFHFKSLNFLLTVSVRY